MGYIDSDGSYVPNPYLNPRNNRDNRDHRHNRHARHHIKYYTNSVLLNQILMILITLLVFFGIIILLINL